MYHSHRHGADTRQPGTGERCGQGRDPDAQRLGALTESTNSNSPTPKNKPRHRCRAHLTHVILADVAQRERWFLGNSRQDRLQGGSGGREPIRLGAVPRYDAIRIVAVHLRCVRSPRRLLGIVRGHCPAGNLALGCGPIRQRFHGRGTSVLCRRSAGGAGQHDGARRQRHVGCDHQLVHRQLGQRAAFVRRQHRRAPARSRSPNGRLVRDRIQQPTRP